MNYEETLLTIQYGVYFNPANKHYNYIGKVTCNRCYVSNLDVCIGYKEFDMCLGCVQEIAMLERKSKNSVCREKSCKVKLNNKDNDLKIDEKKLKELDFDDKAIHEKVRDYEYEEACESDMMGFDLFG